MKLFFNRLFSSFLLFIGFSSVLLTGCSGDDFVNPNIPPNTNPIESVDVWEVRDSLLIGHYIYSTVFGGMNVSTINEEFFFNTDGTYKWVNSETIGNINTSERTEYITEHQGKWRTANDSLYLQRYVLDGTVIDEYCCYRLKLAKETYYNIDTHKYEYYDGPTKLFLRKDGYPSKEYSCAD